MTRRRIPTCFKLFLTGILLWSTTAEAIIFDLKNQANPQIKIRVGGSGGNISEVAFTVPAAQLGDGTAITGSQTIRIQVQIRASGANPLTAFLTVDSLTNPLEIDNPGSTSTIPFSHISWTSRDGDIPSGSFTETVDQPIVDFVSSQRYRDFHTFSYENTLDLEAGTYNGHVIYTWAVP